MLFQLNFLLPGIYLCGRRNDWQGVALWWFYCLTSEQLTVGVLFLILFYDAYIFWPFFFLSPNSDFRRLVCERFQSSFLGVSPAVRGRLLQAALLGRHHLAGAHSPARDLAGQERILVAGHPVFDSRGQVPAGPRIRRALPQRGRPPGHRSQRHVRVIRVPGFLCRWGSLQVPGERVGERGRWLMAEDSGEERGDCHRVSPEDR